MGACYYGNLEIVRTLLESGAAVGVKNIVRSMMMMMMIIMLMVMTVIIEVILIAIAIVTH